MTAQDRYSNARSAYALRIPGRAYDGFARKAYDHVDAGEDLDVCDALSRPRLKVKRRRAGHTST